MEDREEEREKVDKREEEKRKEEMMVKTGKKERVEKAEIVDEMGIQEPK